MVTGASRLSAQYISSSAREGWCQLYARLLLDVKRYSWMLQNYCGDVEQYVARPWLIAMRFCLSQPRNALREIWTRRFEGHGISAFAGERWIVWGLECAENS